MYRMTALHNELLKHFIEKEYRKWFKTFVYKNKQQYYLRGYVDVVLGFDYNTEKIIYRLDFYPFKKAWMMGNNKGEALCKFRDLLFDENFVN